MRYPLSNCVKLAFLQIHESHLKTELNQQYKKWTVLGYCCEIYL